MELDLRYPIGPFAYEKASTEKERERMVEEIAAAPARLERAVSGLSPSQMDTPYRPGGWTVRQTVHHVADSHMNAFTRFKLALTEAEPVIKPYDQALWAELPDSDLPAAVSLPLIVSLHERWVRLLRSMGEEQFQRTLRHPEMGILTLDRMTALYAWHGKHHTAQILSLRRRSNW